MFDECLPRRLKRGLVGHDVWTVSEMGWSGKRNDALLALMVSPGLEVLMTVDQNLQHQQNLLATALVARGAVPACQPRDAFHIAIAAINGLRYLVTWNFKHIANPTRQTGIA